MCFAAALLVWLTNGGWEIVLDVLGRDPSLTGRMTLFAAWPHFFWQQPIFGYGFGGFFGDPLSVEQQQLQILMSTDSFIGTFESSYLEALLQFGIVGAAVLMLLVVACFRRVGQLSWGNRYVGAMLAASAGFILVHSATDTCLLLHNHFFFAALSFIYGLPRSATTA